MSTLQANQGSKRVRDDPADASAGGQFQNAGRIPKVGRSEAVEAESDALVPAGPSRPSPASEPAELKPFPYYYYRNFSKVADPDPLQPLTPPGRVPNFPAKMHSILSRPELSDIIAWMPHGRSWRVLKPREFEIKVIPTYFEHAKFSSFIRQANGWGFRRVTQGRDRNSYYHELFLRGLPHLCKQMKRPGVAEKIASDPEHEPDLYKISEQFPLPDKAEDESVLLHCTLHGGPKARMPVIAGAYSYNSSLTNDISSSWTQTASASKPSADAMSISPVSSAQPNNGSVVKLTPMDQQALSGFQQSLGAAEHMLTASMAPVTRTVLPATPTLPTAAQNVSNVSAPFGNPTPMANFCFPGMTKISPLAAANSLAFAGPAFAANQFAAGFAAAAVLSQQQFQNMFAAQSFGAANGVNGAGAGTWGMFTVPK